MLCILLSMAIVIHDIGNNRYAYEHHRVGKQIKTKYIGPVDSRGNIRASQIGEGVGRAEVGTTTSKLKELYAKAIRRKEKPEPAVKKKPEKIRYEKGIVTAKRVEMPKKEAEKIYTEEDIKKLADEYGYDLGDGWLDDPATQTVSELELKKIEGFMKGRKERKRMDEEERKIEEEGKREFTKQELKDLEKKYGEVPYRFGKDGEKILLTRGEIKAGEKSEAWDTKYYYDGVIRRKEGMSFAFFNMKDGWDNSGIEEGTYGKEGYKELIERENEEFIEHRIEHHKYFTSRGKLREEPLSNKEAKELAKDDIKLIKGLTKSGIKKDKKIREAYSKDITAFKNSRVSEPSLTTEDISYSESGEFESGRKHIIEHPDEVTKSIVEYNRIIAKSGDKRKKPLTQEKAKEISKDEIKNIKEFIDYHTKADYKSEEEAKEHFSKIKPKKTEHQEKEYSYFDEDGNVIREKWTVPSIEHSLKSDKEWLENRYNDEEIKQFKKVYGKKKVLPDDTHESRIIVDDILKEHRVKEKKPKPITRKELTREESERLKTVKTTKDIDKLKEYNSEWKSSTTRVGEERELMYQGTGMKKFVNENPEQKEAIIESRINYHTLISPAGKVRTTPLTRKQAEKSAKEDIDLINDEDAEVR